MDKESAVLQKKIQAEVEQFKSAQKGKHLSFSQFHTVCSILLITGMRNMIRIMAISQRIMLYVASKLV